MDGSSGARMTESRIDWRQWHEFADIDLMQSFVLSWQMQSESLLIDADICLQSGHAFYEPPRPAEKVCIRPAVLEFPYCERIRHANIEGDPATVGTKLTTGRISGLDLVQDGCYALSGRFGDVVIVAERPLLKLNHAF